MKRITLITLVCIVVSSCGMLQTRELQKHVMFIDYTPYTEAGFYLSPNDYPGPHTPVGELNIIVDPAVLRAEKEGYQDGIYQQNDQVYSEDLSSKELLEMAVSEATKRGSNGISNLKIEVITQDYVYYRAEGLLATTIKTTPVNRYVISGVLIRIL